MIPFSEFHTWMGQTAYFHARFSTSRHTCEKQIRHFLIARKTKSFKSVEKKSPSQTHRLVTSEVGAQTLTLAASIQWLRHAR